MQRNEKKIDVIPLPTSFYLDLEWIQKLELF